MKAEELELRNAAIVSALARGESVHAVAATAELSVQTVRIIAMGAGMQLTKEQVARPTEAAQPAPEVRPRLPLSEHFAAMDRRNIKIAAQLRDPSVSIEVILTEHRISESILLTVGWDKGVWDRPRHPKGEGKVARDAMITHTMAQLVHLGAGGAEVVDATLRRFGISSAAAQRLASDAGIVWARGWQKSGPGPSPRTAERNRAIAEALTQRSATVEDLAGQFEISPEYVVRLARDAAVPTPLPRRPSTERAAASARDREIVVRVIECGETLRAVAARFSISAERVRQIVERDSDVTIEERLEARRATRRASQVERVLAIVSGDPGRNLTCREIADEVSLSVGDVQHIIGPMETARRYPIPEPAKFEVRPAVEEMRRVWLVERPPALTGDYYDARRRQGMVSSQSIALRLGSWKRACEVAGVPFKALRGTYERSWTQEDCLDWVGLFLQDTQDVTIATFGRWVNAYTDAPSRHTVAGHLSSWGQVLRQAATRVDNKTWRDPS